MAIPAVFRAEVLWPCPRHRNGHFDPAYRNLPFVREGIFRYTDNAIYTFGFLILWILGLVFLSQAALLVALFNHLYIWVHYYCTELPDIYAIYGKKVKEVTGRAV